MKKLALILTLVLVFSISCVFAAPAPEVSGETSDNDVISGEVLSGESENDVSTVVDSGDEEDLPASGDVDVDTDHDHNHDTIVDDTENTETADTDKSAIVGAIIAIVIVVIVVAIAAILKKD